MKTLMKAKPQTSLRFIYSESVDFTLPIRKRPFPHPLNSLSLKQFTAVTLKEEHAKTWTHVDKATAGCLRIHRRIAFNRLAVEVG